MAPVNPCPFLQAGSYPAVNVRQMTGGMVSAGIVEPGDLLVSQNGTPNMSVNVAAGSCYVLGTQVTNQGTYFCLNDGVENVAVANSDPTNPRIDLVVAQVADSEYTAGASDAWSLAVIEGTPLGTPVAPSAPPNAIVLAQIAVAASAGSITDADITDMRTRAVALGGTTVCTSGTRPTNPVEGTTIYETDTGDTLVYQNAHTGWTPPWNTAWGEIGKSTLTQTGPGIGATTVTINGSTVTITAPGNRRYRILFRSALQSNEANDTYVLNIQRNNASLNNGGYTTVNPLYANLYFSVQAESEDTPAAGTVTYKVVCGRGTGGGAGTMSAAGFVSVEDIGPTGPPPTS